MPNVLDWQAEMKSILEKSGGGEEAFDRREGRTPRSREPLPPAMASRRQRVSEDTSQRSNPTTLQEAKKHLRRITNQLEQLLDSVEDLSRELGD